jgi:ABC-type enterobactin transport system permease subunit
MTNSDFSVRLWRLPTVFLALFVGVALCLGLALPRREGAIMDGMRTSIGAP